MRRALATALAAVSLTALGPGVVHGQEEGASETEAAVEGGPSNAEGLLEDAGLGDESEEESYDEAIGYDTDDWGYDTSEFAAFEDDDLIADPHGFYDADFDWETDDEDWNAWYEGDAGVWAEDGDDEGFWDW